MIKFFRKIRQRLLTENKFSKYFLYAIGEIFLVVIGILIALQINNWNQNLKELKKENELLISLQQEISANIKLLELLRINNDMYAADGSEIIQTLVHSIDSLSNSDVTRAFNFVKSSFKYPVLNGIVASNSDALHKNKELIVDFRILKDAYDNVIIQESYLDEFWNSKVVDFFILCGIQYEDNQGNEMQFSMSDIEIGGYTKKQFIALIKIKSVLQEYWENERKNALEKSRAVLIKLDNIK